MWLHSLSEVIGLLALLYIPGYAFLRLFWFGKRQALAAAPVTFAAGIGLQGILWKMLGISWRPETVLIPYVVVALICAYVVYKRHKAADPAPTKRTISKPVKILLPLLALGATFALVGPFLSVSPNVPLQGWDPIFHANGVAVVEANREASYFGSLTSLYGLNTTPTNYAVAWHAIASLIATPHSIVQTINSFIAVISIVWITSMWGLIRSLGWGNRFVLAFLAIVPAMIVYPTYMLSAYAPLPNSFEQAIFPGLLTLIAITIREGIRDRNAKIFLLRILAIVGISVGAVFVHPSAATSLALIMLVPGIGLLVRYYKQFSKRAKTIVWSLVGVAVVGLAGVLIVVPSFRDRLTAQLAYQTTPGRVTLGVLMKSVTAWPMIQRPASTAVMHNVSILQVILLILLILGIARLLYLRKRRWLIGVWIVTVLLTFTTISRQGPLVPIAGLWYMSPHRTMALQQVPMGVLVAVGLVTLAEIIGLAFMKYRRGKTVVLIVVLVVTQVAVSALSWGARSFLVDRAWGQESAPAAMVSEDELAMLYRLRHELPDDALVLGDPANGSAFVKAISGHDVVFPQVYIRDSNEEEWFLAEHFRDIHHDPRVCEVINDLGITHFYEDRDAFNLGRSSRSHTPGLYDVSTWDGFKQIDSGGSATLYEITACRP